MVALGQPSAVRTRNQPVVVICRCRQIQQCLQKPMDVRRREKVFAADDIGHALQCIVRNDGQMIACARILACDDHIAKLLWPRRDDAVSGIAPFKIAGSGSGLRRVKPPGMGFAGDACVACLFVERAACSGIHVCIAVMRRTGGGGYIGARAEARIHPSACLQPVERGGIVGHMLRLPAHRLFPANAKPGKVVENRGDEVFAATPGIDILDPQQQSTVPRAGKRIGGQRRIGVTEVQQPRRAWRKAGDDADKLVSGRISGKKTVDRFLYQVVS